MQRYCLSRLTASVSAHFLKRSGSQTSPLVFNKLHHNGILRTNALVRFSSTASNQGTSNDDQKNNTTNVIYVVGALTGLGALYSIMRKRRNNREKEDAVAAYDEKTESSKKTSTENVEKVKDETPTESVEVLSKELLATELPNSAQYLIIGGGCAAMSAFKSIRAHDPTAKVLVISGEKYMPYMRPPLSKDIWYTDDDELIKKHSFKQWNGKEKSLYFFDDEFYVEPKALNQQENGGVAVALDRKVVELDLKNSVAKLDNGWEITFEKCLLATGGQPKNLKIFETASSQLKKKVTLFRGIDDFLSLKQVIDKGSDVIIVGGGFLGSELACALAHRAKKNAESGKSTGKVIQLMAENGNISKVLPEYLSNWASDRVREEGAEVIGNVELTGASVQDNKITLSYKSPNEPHKTQYIKGDHVVVAVGITPNTSLAKSAGLEVDSAQGGFLVNAELQARHNVWVAGDAASFYDIKLGRRRVEHHDHAIVSGKLAGENMTGSHKPYWHQSMFWSDLGPTIGFEAIGLTDSSLQTVAVYAKSSPNDETPKVDSEGNREQKDEAEKSTKTTIDEHSKSPNNKDQYQKGVVFYLKDNKVVGVVLWNVFNRIPIARKIIKDQAEVTDFQELAKLFNIHQD